MTQSHADQARRMEALDRYFASAPVAPPPCVCGCCWHLPKSNQRGVKPRLQNLPLQPHVKSADIQQRIYLHVDVHEPTAKSRRMSVIQPAPRNRVCKVLRTVTREERSLMAGNLTGHRRITPPLRSIIAQHSHGCIASVDPYYRSSGVRARSA